MHAVGQVSHLAERGKGVFRCGTPHHHHLSQESGSVRDLLPLSPPAAPPPQAGKQETLSPVGEERDRCFDVCSQRAVIEGGAGRGSDARE